MSARNFIALVAPVVLMTLVYPSLACAEDVAGVVRVNGRPQRDVVVWLDGVPGSTNVVKKPVLDQRNLTFSPHVLAIKTGSRVNMPNSDRVFHNVFSFRDGKRFDLGLYPVGRSKTVTFDQPGVSRIFCNIHPGMAAYVVAVDSDHYAVSDETGGFTLAGVPAGTYTYHTWRAGHDPSTGRVSVEANRRLELDLK